MSMKMGNGVARHLRRELLEGDQVWLKLRLALEDR